MIIPLYNTVFHCVIQLYFYCTIVLSNVNTVDCGVLYRDETSHLGEICNLEVQWITVLDGRV